MEINSSIARVDHSTEQLFSKLSSVETYECLMPEGAAFTKIDDNRFRFKLGGMPETLNPIYGVINRQYAQTVTPLLQTAARQFRFRVQVFPLV